MTGYFTGLPPEAAARAMEEGARAMADVKAYAQTVFAAVEAVHAKRGRLEAIYPQSPSAHAEGRKTLFKSGKLWLSLTENTKDSVREIEGNMLTYGTKAVSRKGYPYPAALTAGGFIFPRSSLTLRFKIGGKWVFTKMVYLPPREFVGLFSEEEVGHVNDAILDYVADRMRRAAAAAGGALDLRSTPSTAPGG